MKKVANSMNMAVLTTLLLSLSIFALCVISTNNFQMALAKDSNSTAASQGSNGTTASSTASTTTNAITTSNTSNSATTINLTVKEVIDGVYKWINVSNSAQNPTIKVFANTNNIINIQNPTDTKHNLIIDTGADNLPSSGDILHDGSGHVTFNPSMTGTFTYHCAYHPYTMKGTIEVIKK